jgi:hypothetical protein
MSTSIDVMNDKQILIVVSNPAVSEQTGWPIGFWWAELLVAGQQQYSGAAAARLVIAALGQ